VFKISEKIVAFLSPDTIEPQALEQLINTSEAPVLAHHLAVMPDCHYGKGSTVGSVIPTAGGIIPAAVGVDIGCGMIAIETTLSAGQLPDNLHRIEAGIERRIPLGAGAKNTKITSSAQERIGKLTSKAAGIDYRTFSGWQEQLGTLGSGNHFVEVCLDEAEQVWLVLHSGSRGVGNRIASHHIKIAQKLMDLRKVPLKDCDLAYLPEQTPEFRNYIRDLLWAQDYALMNREEMMDRAMTELSYNLFGEAGHEQAFTKQRINCHHNFTQMETHFGKNMWITRKGAIQMKEGQLGVIPGSMGTRSYIVSGLGNVESYHSAPHGAGRRMSRNKARETFTMQDLETAMQGVASRLRPSLIDEIPGAYKDIDEVMENSRELVKIEHTLKQIVNVKGD
jgi:tRNA-splicing ligase RtcB (3'-phosphate/5'-hydroxy nucleic acid ligase)